MKSNSNISDYDDYHDDLDHKKRIKKVDSEHNKRREIKNWKKAWSEHLEDYDEMDDFYAKPRKI